MINRPVTSLTELTLRRISVDCPLHGTREVVVKQLFSGQSDDLNGVSVGRYDTSADSEVYGVAATALLMLSVGPDLF